MPAFQMQEQSHDDTEQSDCACPYECDDCKKASHDDKSDEHGSQKCCDDCNLCRHSDLTQSALVIGFTGFDVAVVQATRDVTMPGHSLPADIFHPPCVLPAAL
jgi:hypothetical protein